MLTADDSEKMSREGAFRAIESATVNIVNSRSIVGVFQVVVNVGQTQVTVRGAVIGDLVAVATAFAKQ